MTPTPWRQGSKVPQNVYAANGAPIAQFHDASVASLVVAAVNRCAALADALETAAIIIHAPHASILSECPDVTCASNSAALRTAGRF